MIRDTSVQNLNKAVRIKAVNIGRVFLDLSTIGKGIRCDEYCW